MIFGGFAIVTFFHFLACTFEIILMMGGLPTHKAHLKMNESEIMALDVRSIVHYIPKTYRFSALFETRNMKAYWEFNARYIERRIHLKSYFFANEFLPNFVSGVIAILLKTEMEDFVIFEASCHLSFEKRKVHATSSLKPRQC